MKCVIRVLRLLLCILIMFCGAVIGLHFSQRLTRRRDILLGFEKLFHRAQTQISYNSGCLCEVFGENFASFVFSRSLPFDEQWERFVRQFSYFLSKDDAALLLDFSRGLGTADGEAQQKHIAMFSELLRGHIQNAQEEIGNKSKAFRIIPLSVGMAIALLMV